MSIKHRTSIFALAAVLAACSANPGPAPVEQARPSKAVATSTTQTPDEPARLSVGIDPIYAGLNPHLLADDSEFVRTLAQLVLPSTFVDGQMNKDLLESAKPVTPADDTALTIRYDINPEAQWSDGTPITVSDFEYLRSGVAQTPGTLDAARYRAISDIRSANGGRTVFVDFDQPIAHWQTMFLNLLPSHVLKDESGFDQALREDIPASGWRFSLNSVDRSRGVITLNRNDRFWGAKPAQVETLQFVEVRSLPQAAEMLRSGQLSFVDMTPTEVATDTFKLIPDTQVRTTVLDRRLQVTATTKLNTEQRASLASMIEPATLARLATGRSTALEVEQPLEAIEPQPEALRSLGRPVVIGVDPSDPAALAATRALVDVLRNADIPATIETSDTTDLFQNALPEGELDALITWTPAIDRDQYHCDGEVVAANLSTMCVPEVEAIIDQVIAGKATSEDLAAAAKELEAAEHLSTVIVRDVRLQALGRGIVGPNPSLERWPAGLSSLAEWTINKGQ
ncbi:ABC transporter family substrate-binding protein [Corynebacterium pseudopelargi]|uniref:Putative monoacyl phosphatidylinositol tetramannoside-binding protein LpqW n=1 Tax=Corynebacterium pseudopelargi TaxID=2080757 RepID=A0A3G6IV32_9CORY|nr:ABC transporter family substrate-binding protein [Corynebacterium pseudopelargi]AZA09562.1 putative monoacyl phosphatidylinositol tetramannoside-binding protein LpqW precursor [Corynebacterium pseudopelargi]